MMFVPTKNKTSYKDDVTASKLKMKKILFWGRSWSSLSPGRDVFIKEQCPVSTCEITTSRFDSGTIDD